MRNTNSKSILGRTAAAGALLLGAAFAGQAAMACTLDNWSSNSGAVSAGDPFAEGIARYSGLCGMQATGAGYVQDDNPGGIDRIVARFYVLNTNTATAEIYSGYGDNVGGSERFNVTLDNAGGVTLTDTATGQSVTQSGGTAWLSVEIDWAQGAGNGVISLSVNGQTPAENTTLNNAGAQLQSVRLGNIDGAAGNINFDAYESRRSTAVGRLVTGDANNDGAVTVFDAIAIVNESAGPGSGTLATGQPDCNEDGGVTVFDAICAINVAAGP